MQKPDARYVLDSYALLVFFKRQPGWHEVQKLLSEAATSGENLLMALINWGEVHYVTLRDRGQKDAEKVVQVIDILPITIVSPDRAMTLQAGTFKALGGIAYPDCFAAALAAKENASVVTGDPEFKKLEKLGLVRVRWI